MRSPCEIGRKVQAKVFVLSEASKWMAINMVNITLHGFVEAYIFGQKCRSSCATCKAHSVYIQNVLMVDRRHVPCRKNFKTTSCCESNRVLI